MKSIICLDAIAVKRTAATVLLCLAAFFAATDLSAAATNETFRLVSAVLRQTNGPLDTMFKFCVGAGRANEGLRADWQRQLVYAHRECGFQYIRMHGLFCDDMGVYREDSSGNPEYNWQYIDKLYDFLHGIGMKPFVELGFMPSALASGSKTIFWWRGNVTPPKDISARPILNKVISRLSSEGLSLNAEGVGGKRLPTATPKTSARIAIRLSVTGERRVSILAMMSRVM